jgi:hypothetical protein
MAAAAFCGWFCAGWLVLTNPGSPDDAIRPHTSQSGEKGEFPGPILSTVSPRFGQTGLDCGAVSCDLAQIPPFAGDIGLNMERQCNPR